MLSPSEKASHLWNIFGVIYFSIYDGHREFNIHSFSAVVYKLADHKLYWNRSWFSVIFDAEKSWNLLLSFEWEPWFYNFSYRFAKKNIYWNVFFSYSFCILHDGHSPKNTEQSWSLKVIGGTRVTRDMLLCECNVTDRQKHWFRSTLECSRVSTHVS